MAQHSNEHLTTAQISAYLDKDLAADELSLCQAHLQTCSSCQDTLTDLRLTSSLLHSMPQVDVPRSFVLPLNIAVLPQTPNDITAPLTRRPPQRVQHRLGRSLYILSSLAAILGLFFVLSGAIGSLPHNMMTAASTSSNGTTSSAASPINPLATSTTSVRISPDVQASQQILATSTPASIIPVATPINQLLPSTPPARLDPGQPLGRLGIGSLLFLLGILGAILTRSFRPGKTQV